MGTFRVGMLIGLDKGARGRNSTALCKPEETDCFLTAVASKSEEKAKAFVKSVLDLLKPKYVEATIATMGGDDAFDNLINSDIVDAVYVALPTSSHEQWVKAALRAGKHVLVDIPVALSGADYGSMLATAYQHQRLLMDATKIQHHNRLSDILKVLSNEEKIGRVDRIHACFTYLKDGEFFTNDSRIRKDGSPSGCLGQLGWYAIHFAIEVYRVLGVDQIKSVKTVDYKLTHEGVPIDATCVIRFGEGRVLWLHCGFMTRFRQRIEICGTKSSLIVDDFVFPGTPPNKYVLESGYFDKETKACSLVPEQEVLMWKRFAQLSRGLEEIYTPPTPAETESDSADAQLPTEWKGEAGVVREANRLSRISLSIQKVVDALVKSIDEGSAEVDVV